MAETKTAPAKGGNQSEKEYFAIVGTGRQGVEEMLARKGEEIRTVSAPNVAGNFDVWKARALVEICNRDELVPVLASREGIFTVYKALAKASTMGLQIGGVFPHAYLMPKEGKAILVVTAEGYAFCAAHGPGAVLKNVPELVEVYEKDPGGIRIDASAGTVEHKFDPFADRGKMVGYYMILAYRDEHREVPYITIADVRDIQEKYSRMLDSHGKLMPSFSKSPKMMDRKTAAKQLLKKPARESEGLAMLLTADEEIEPEPPPMRNVSERASTRLDDAAAHIGAETVPVAHEEVASEPTSEPAKTPAGKAPDKGDLF